MKTFFVWLIVLIVLVGGIYWAVHNSSPSPVLQNTQTQTQPNPEPVVNQTASSTTTMASSTAAHTFTVSYNDQGGFNPKVLGISAGDSVTFINNSTKNMWVASDPHPVHTGYDGTTLSQHCAAGATPSLDECTSVPKGGTYTFTFTKVGSWGYHNHDNHADTGTITVK